MLRDAHLLKPDFGEPPPVRQQLTATTEADVEQLARGAQPNAETSAIWSGGVVRPPDGATVNTVYGEWVVPRPYPPALNGTFSYDSTWVGIDGDGSSDILLAGITANTMGVQVFGNPQVVVSAYAWYDWWSPETVDPRAVYPKVIPNFPFAFGEKIACYIYVTSTRSANIDLYNMSRRQMMPFSLNAPPDTSLVGNCAEWIVERPTDPVSLRPTQLANYGSVAFESCFAVFSDGTNASSDAGSNINMTDDVGGVISVGNLVGADVVTCTYI
ncbi:G1 family glutamic endopeptidase [Streptomyces sp. NPDC001544]|uniref:G1 family glutamic endopeptidase n=1 Tax=Streptomyces sp. NPDC001544 TaxID=3364584 RepID=UPI0036BB6B75